jgi:hypothetical protein
MVHMLSVEMFATLLEMVEAVKEDIVMDVLTLRVEPLNKEVPTVDARLVDTFKEDKSKVLA